MLYMERAAIETRIEGWIQNAFLKKPDIYKVLIRFERFPKVQRNIVAQCHMAEIKFQKRCSMKHIAWIIDNLTYAYCKAALLYMEQQNKSSVWKATMQAKETKKKEVDDWLEKNIRITDRSREFKGEPWKR